MKIFDHEKGPLVSRRIRPQNLPLPAEGSVEARCKERGIKTNPATIRSRMQRRGMSFDEAVAYVPKTRRQCGKAGKDKSVWGRNTPASSEEYQARQGRTSRYGVEPKE